MNTLRSFICRQKKQGALYAADDFSNAKKVAAWKAFVRKAWAGVTIRRLDTPFREISFGEAVDFRVAVRLNGLHPEDVVVELLICRRLKKTTLCSFKHVRFEFSGIEEDSAEHLFELDHTPDLCGKLEYYIRVYPYHALLTHPFEMGMMVWL